MITKAFLKFSTIVQRKLRLLFIVSFVAGIVTGAGLSKHVDDSLLSLTYNANCGTTTFFGLAVVLLIPLLISFTAFHFSVPILILPIAFLKAVFFGFCSCYIMFVYGDAGWLVRFLILFSDSAMLIVLCWYWLKHLEINRFQLKQNTLMCLWIAIIIGITDYMYISPFAAMLLQR